MIRATWFPPLQADGHYVPRVRALRDANGCYAIREPRLLGGPEVVYVGQSSSGCLYRTLTRHFQAWSRTARGSFWERERGPCHTYDPRHCEVAVWVVAPARVAPLEARLIAAMQPRDNGRAEVPF